MIDPLNNRTEEIQNIVQKYTQIYKVTVIIRHRVTEIRYSIFTLCDLL